MSLTSTSHLSARISLIIMTMILSALSLSWPEALRRVALCSGHLRAAVEEVGGALHHRRVIYLLNAPPVQVIVISELMGCTEPWLYH